MRNITSYDTNAVGLISQTYTQWPVWSHSVPRLWINTVIIIMSLASLCHNYMLSSVDCWQYLSVVWVHCLCKLQ